MITPISLWTKLLFKEVDNVDKVEFIVKSFRKWESKIKINYVCRKMVENSQFCQFAERVYCLAKDMEKYFLNPFVNERGQLLERGLFRLYFSLYVSWSCLWVKSKTHLIPCISQTAASLCDQRNALFFSLHVFSLFICKAKVILIFCY